MDLTDQLGYEILALLFDAPAPLSVVFPEARRFLPATRAVDPLQLMRWLDQAQLCGWVLLTIDDGNQPRWPYRAATPSDMGQIAEEYVQAQRNPDEIWQILDRFDLRIEISEEGVAAVRSVWPEMPTEA